MFLVESPIEQVSCVFVLSVELRSIPMFTGPRGKIGHSAIGTLRPFFIRPPLRDTRPCGRIIWKRGNKQTTLGALDGFSRTSRGRPHNCRNDSMFLNMIIGIISRVALTIIIMSNAVPNGAMYEPHIEVARNCAETGTETLKPLSLPNLD